MRKLSGADARAVLDVVRITSAITDVEEFPAVVTRVLHDVVECDGTGYNEVDTTIPRIIFVTDPGDYVPPDFGGRWERWSHQHPILADQLRTGDGSAKKISDFDITEGTVRKHLERVYRKLGVQSRTEKPPRRSSRRPAASDQLLTRARDGRKVAAPGPMGGRDGGERVQGDRARRHE